MQALPVCKPSQIKQWRREAFGSLNFVVLPVTTWALPNVIIIIIILNIYNLLLQCKQRVKWETVRDRESEREGESVSFMCVVRITTLASAFGLSGIRGSSDKLFWLRERESNKQKLLLRRIIVVYCYCFCCCCVEHLNAKWKWLKMTIKKYYI